MKRFATLVLCLAFFCPLALAGNLELVKDGRSDFVIVIPRDASPAIARGAKELQLHLAQMSGAEIPIIDDQKRAPAHAILVGPTRFSAASDPRLGDDGFRIRSDGSSLMINGPGARGTMYGCTTFLEMLGVRWFTPKVTSIPERSTISVPAMDITQTPAFEYREPFFAEAWDKDWSARNKVNGHFHRLDDSTGGRIAYSMFVHTFDTLIPQSLYDQHPEYFPLIDGKRAPGYVQRCLTNPAVLALAIEGVRKSFKENPQARICSVSQNDCQSWCQCENCARLTKEFGAHSGLYLWFVNQVAEAVEKDCPGKLIDTLAYQFTEAPPTGITPRTSVRIRLCPIAVCEAHPYVGDDHPASRAFVSNLQAWSKVTDSLYIWHYNTDFAHYLMPFPDFGEFPAVTRLYKNSGVKGIFFEGDATPGASDAELRSYVMARLLWDTATDTDAAVTEWMKGVYGPAWEPMRRWFDLPHEQARQPHNHLGIYDPPGAAIFPPELLAQGQALLSQAQALAQTPLQRECIERAGLGLRYVKLMLAPHVGDDLTMFLADAKRLGVASLSEGGTYEGWEAAYRRAAGQ